MIIVNPICPRCGEPVTGRFPDNGKDRKHPKCKKQEERRG